MLVNQNTFNLESTITDNWGGRHRVAIDLEALSSTDNWKMEISLPSDYEIKEIYGAEIIEENGKTYVSGKSWNESLNQGDQTEIVLIVDEGNSRDLDPIKPRFIFSDSMSSTPTSAKLNAAPAIVEDWDGGYKIELDITAESKADGWTLDFNLPYEISEVYGVDLVNNGNGSYTINGQNDQVNLQPGQSIKPIFVVQDNGQEAIAPEFMASGSEMIVEPTITEVSKVTEELESKLNAVPAIVEDWDDGYKIELDITAESKADGWTLDFNLPYEISEAYGADLVNNGNGSYTINGQNDQANLQPGQSIKSIFIVQDNGQQALVPSFGGSVTAPASPIEDIPNNSSSNNPQSVNIPNSNGESVGQQGKFAYGEALQKNFLFLESNRSGALGPENRLEWRTDSTTNDGSTVGRDLEGGYFDAGDHVKFGQPMAASVNMLAWGGVEYTDAYKQSGQFDELLDSVKWGTDYFLKAHETEGGKTSKFWVQVGEGGTANDHGYWGAPEDVENNTTRNAFAIDANNPGSDVAASTSSALAAASMLFRGVDDQYADELLKNAKQLFDFAETHQGKYSDSVSQASPFYTSWSGYGDELASGAAWLAKATGEESYLTKAENHLKIT